MMIGVGDKGVIEVSSVDHGGFDVDGKFNVVKC